MADKVEKFCAEIFEKHLKEKMGFKNLNWTDLSKEKDDPPDFFLKIRDNKFAVEVTQTEVQHENSSGELIGYRTYINSLDTFIDGVEGEALDKNILNGSFCVIFNNPINNFNKVKRKLKEELLVFLKKDKQTDGEKETPIIINDEEICFIQKISQEGKCLGAVFCEEAEWVWSPEHIEKVSEILQDPITRKREKLKKEIIDIPIILIILNTYPLSGKGLLKKCVDNLRDLEYYHSIFVVLPEVGTGFFLECSF